MEVVLKIACAYPVGAGRDSERVRRVGRLFGLGREPGGVAPVVSPIRLALAPGRIVLVTGASGGGKSTLLRLASRRLARRGVRVIDLGERGAEARARRAVIDTLGETFEQALACLSRAGLAEARLMLRRPCELSEGERFRWRLARCMARAEGSDAFTVVVCDELGSTLDRLAAAVCARSVRRWVKRSGVCLLAATAHDDLIEHLGPDTLIAPEPHGATLVWEA